MVTSDDGKELIKHFESLHDGDLTMIGLQPKRCPANIWTCGWGHAIEYEGEFLRGIENKNLAYSLYSDMSIEDAEDLLKTDLSIFEKKLSRLNLDITQNQFDALISFCFNLGFGAFLNSTLRKRIINGGDIEGAFLMWNKCNGEVLRGLTYRRQSEAGLYLKNELIFNN